MAFGYKPVLVPLAALGLLGELLGGLMLAGTAMGINSLTAVLSDVRLRRYLDLLNPVQVHGVWSGVFSLCWLRVLGSDADGWVVRVLVRKGVRYGRHRLSVHQR